MGDSPKWVKRKKRRKYSRDCGWPRQPWPNAGRKKQKKRPKNHFFLHISFSYAKILGEKLFRTWEIPRSGSKGKNGEKKEKERDRLKVGDNNGQAKQGARKHAWRTQAAWANIYYSVVTSQNSEVTRNIIVHKNYQSDNHSLFTLIEWHNKYSSGQS